MKRYLNYCFLASLALLLFSNALFAQLTADRRTLSLGDVQLYTQQSATFTLKNSTRSDLTIERIVTSASQTKAECSKLVIAAGQSATFNVTATMDLAGRFTQAILVYVQNSETPLTLHLKGRAVLDLESMQQSYQTKPTVDEFGIEFGDLLFSTDNIEFDYVNDGDVVSKQIYVTNIGQQDAEPNLLLLPSYLSVQSNPTILKPGRRGMLTVTLDSRKLHHRMGLTQDMAYASSFTGQKAEAQNKIPVSVVLIDTTSIVRTQRAPIIELSQTELSLPLEKKAKVSGYITITNNGRSPLEIKSLQTFHPAINVALSKSQIQPNETLRLKVTKIKKYLDVSSASHRILLITNDYKRPAVLINITD